MGLLKPGVAYIYENDGGNIWAREPGQQSRILIGQDPESTRKSLEEKVLWHNILQASKNNPALQEALDRVIMIYELSKNG